MKMVQGPLFGTVYEFSSFEDINASGQRFQNMRAESKGFVQDPEFYEQLKSLNESFSRTGFDVKDVDDLQDDPFDPEAVEGERYEQSEGEETEQRAGAPTY
jgi:hypothetical protein